MENLTLHLRLASLLTLILLGATAAYSQITPLGDTYTNSADTTTNYGAQKTLNVDAEKEITYIQFNLASVPTGASISQATLKLYVNTVTTAGAFELYAVNGTWTESGLTYSLAPALGSVIDSSVPITTADKNQYILIPMTSTVQGWINTPSSNNGVALVAVGDWERGRMRTPMHTGFRLKSKRLLPIAAATCIPSSTERPKRRASATCRQRREASRSRTINGPACIAATPRRRRGSLLPPRQNRLCPEWLRHRTWLRRPIRRRKPINRRSIKSSAAQPV